jgi:hypothetical protein
MAISQNLEKGTIHMNMEMMITKLVQGVLTDEEIEKSKRVDTPMIITPLSKLENREVPKSDFDYLSVVGSLLHISNSVRCDISYAVGVLARHSLTPGYAPDVSRRSTMGSVLMMNGGPISWKSVLGKTVATSTCEAEVNAAVTAVKDAIHIKRMLFDIGVMKEDHVLQIAEDNAACIAQAQAGLKLVRNAKHYEVKLRFLQQHVLDKSVEFVYCPTDEQLSDMFTKPLEGQKFKYFRDIIMVQI